MPTGPFRCDDPGRGPDRRTLLAVGLAGLSGIAGMSLAQAAGGELRIADLVIADGGASELARSRAGSSITLRGYLAPSLDGELFGLSERSPGICQLCGAAHDLGAALQVRTAIPDPAAPVMQPVEVSGRLAVDPVPGSAVSLQGARIRAL